MVQNHRKPDVVLVSAEDSKKPKNLFSSILSYAEIKAPNSQRNESQRLEEARRQLVDLASLVTSVQRGRRFFVGLGLCNAQLMLAIFIRGCNILTTTLNINEDPKTFLNILLTITDASSTWMGFDPRFSGPKEVTIGDHVYDIPRTIFRSLGVDGKGTSVYHLRRKVDTEGSTKKDYVLKESWANVNWPTDVEIYNLMKTAPPAPITSEEEKLFGLSDEGRVFTDSTFLCQDSDADWNYVQNLPGLPVVEMAYRPHCNNPSHQDECATERYRDRLCEDSTVNILQRMEISMINIEPRVHESVLFQSIGVPLFMFSSRRELLNAFLGYVCGKLIISHITGF